MTEHSDLTGALLALQAELPKVGKDKTADVVTKTGGSYKYKYANLETVQEALFPLLQKHGLVWITAPTLTEHGFALHYEMRHGTERLTGDYYLPQAGPQDIGSAITYARRYALCAVTGLAPGGDDDDGKAAQKVSQQPAAAAADPAVSEWLEVIAGADSEAKLKSTWTAIGESGLGSESRLIRATNARKKELQSANA